MKQTFIEYLYPGIIMCDTSTTEVANRDIPKDIPEPCIAFRFFDKTIVKIEEETLKGKANNFSGWHYLNSKEYSLSEMETEHPGLITVISNMKTNKSNRAVVTNWGQVFLLEDNDVILS